MEDTDHARRFALLLASSIGTFTFLALWMAANWNVLLAVLSGIGAGAALFFPLRALMGLFFRPPRQRRKPRR